jgi:uncharacterized integral membrane protein
VSTEPEKRSWAHHDHLAKLVLIGILIALLVAFILGNSEQVRVSFVFFHSRFSLIWVLLVTNLLGFIAGYLLHSRLGVRRGRPKS